MVDLMENTLGTLLVFRWLAGLLGWAELTLLAVRRGDGLTKRTLLKLLRHLSAP